MPADQEQCTPLRSNASTPASPDLSPVFDYTEEQSMSSFGSPDSRESVQPAAEVSLLSLSSESSEYGSPVSDLDPPVDFLSESHRYHYRKSHTYHPYRPPKQPSYSAESKKPQQHVRHLWFD